MKITDYKFKRIYFAKLSDTGKTSRWACYNNSSDDFLGSIEWYTRWRQYCFWPEDHVELVLSGGCLNDISIFMTELRKQELAERNASPQPIGEHHE